MIVLSLGVVNLFLFIFILVAKRGVVNLVSCTLWVVNLGAVKKGLYIWIVIDSVG